MLETVLGTVLLILLYFFPTIVAYWHKHTYAELIMIVNLLFGWTIVMWVIALLMALTDVEDSNE